MTLTDKMLIMLEEQEDENNNSNQLLGRPLNEAGLEDAEVLTLYVRAGCDNRKYGACPFCQRIFMLLMLKSASNSKITTIHFHRIIYGYLNAIFNR